MGLLDKIFGPGTNAAAPARTTSGSVPSGGPPPLKAREIHGRAGEPPREERVKTLEENFQRQWNAPDELAHLLANALQDGFAAESLAAARQLSSIDSQVARGAHLLGTALLQLKHFEEAEKVTIAALRRTGDNGALLTNLARAFAGRGDQGRAERALWKAIEVDPNFDEALSRYATVQRERGGRPAELEAYQRIAAIAGSWRAQLRLAEDSLRRGDIPAALTFYRVVLERLSPVTADALMQIGGDLEQHRLWKETIEICGPYFHPGEHGLPVGNILLRAYLELHDATNARQLLDQLRSLKHRDWQQRLAYWEGEIGKLSKGLASPVLENVGEHGIHAAPQAIAQQEESAPIAQREDSRTTEVLPAVPEPFLPSEDLEVSFDAASVEATSRNENFEAIEYRAALVPPSEEPESASLAENLDEKAESEQPNTADQGPESESIPSGAEPEPVAPVAPVAPVSPIAPIAPVPIAENGKMETQILVLNGPIWAREDSSFFKILRAKGTGAPRISFLCGSVELPAPADGDRAAGQSSEDAGSFSRGLPMFLAERVHLKTVAATSLLVPWSNPGGFQLASQRRTLDELSALDPQPDFVVSLHLVASRIPWRAELRIERVRDRKAVSQWEQVVKPDASGDAIREITRRTLCELEAKAKVERFPPDEGPPPPSVDLLSRYVSGLEKTLGVLGAERTPDEAPSQDSVVNAIECLLQLGTGEPGNVTMRLLLLNVVEWTSVSRPEVAQGFRERVERLVRDHPLPPPARELAEDALARIFREA